MRISFTLTDDKGRVFSGTADLRLGGLKKSRQAKSTTLGETAPTVALNFNLNPRAFMRRYARSKSGAQRFALVVAMLSRGNEATEVPYAQITKTWNSMKGLLGGAYNPAHSTRAKDRGWVDTRKTGRYKLGEAWNEAFA